MSNLRFYDLVIKSPEIENYHKEALDGVTVIDCTNVARYFFEESDQEHWDMDDFPNVAPPFESFWLDFHAPDRIVSKEYGTTIWKQTQSPTKWGFFCYGISLKTEDERQQFLDTNYRLPEHQAYFTSIIEQARWAMDMYIF